jgi:hypothetical protein
VCVGGLGSPLRGETFAYPLCFGYDKWQAFSGGSEDTCDDDFYFNYKIKKATGAKEDGPMHFCSKRRVSATFSLQCLAVHPPLTHIHTYMHTYAHAIGHAATPPLQDTHRNCLSDSTGSGNLLLGATRGVHTPHTGLLRIAAHVVGIRLNIPTTRDRGPYECGGLISSRNCRASDG